MIKLPPSVSEDGKLLRRYFNIVEDDILVIRSKKGDNRFFFKNSPLISVNIDEDIVIQFGEDQLFITPIIKITSHNNNEVVTKNKINLRGSISQRDKIKDLFINDEKVKGLSKTGLFSIDITLVSGENLIVLKAFDKKNNPTIASLKLYFNIAPSVALEIPNAPKITILFPKNNEIVFESFVEIKVTIDDPKIITIKITDGENEVHDIGFINGVFSAKVVLTKNSNIIKVEAENAAGIKSEKFVNVIKSGTSAEVDEDGPVIEVTSHSDGDTVEITPINLKGTVNDPEVTLITVNAQNIKVVGGKWETILSMELGGNIIELEAEDNAGNLGTETINLTFTPRKKVKK